MVVSTANVNEDALSKVDHQLTKIQAKCERKSSAIAAELTFHEIDANYSAVDVTDEVNVASTSTDEDASKNTEVSLGIEHTPSLALFPDKLTSTNSTPCDIDVNYSAVDEIDQTNYTYSSGAAKFTEKPPFPARLQCKPASSVYNADSKLVIDSEILSIYDSIGPKLTSSAVSVELSSHVDEVEDATYYSVVDVRNVASVEKTKEKPPLPRRPEGKLHPPLIPGRSPTTSELSSQDIDCNYSVVDETSRGGRSHLGIRAGDSVCSQCVSQQPLATKR